MAKRFITIIRHGSTILNEQDRIRAWLDVPLSKEGIAVACQTAEQLKTIPIDVIVCSDLVRTRDTASIFSLILKKPISLITELLRPWDVGELTGKKIKEILPELIAHTEDKPDEPIEGGESFNAFKERFLNAFLDILETYDGLDIAFVVHHRNERVLEAWIKQGMKTDLSIDVKEMGKEGIEPGKYRVYEL